jgi:surface antigen
MISNYVFLEQSMKKVLAATLVLFTTISIIGCTNQDAGTLGGGVLGGLIGSRFGGGSGQILAVGAGALAGAYLGGKLGKNMDDADRARMNNAFENNSNGQPAYWQNQKTGTTYDVVPTRNVVVNGNQYCREYRSTAVIAGKRQQMYGTACRQPDGTWQTVSSN